MYSLEDWLAQNRYLEVSCPDCGDIYYNDAPTFCTTCGCEGGLGKISLDTFVKEIVLKDK